MATKPPTSIKSRFRSFSARKAWLKINTDQLSLGSTPSEPLGIISYPIANPVIKYGSEKSIVHSPWPVPFKKKNSVYIKLSFMLFCYSARLYFHSSPRHCSKKSVIPLNCLVGTIICAQSPTSPNSSWAIAPSLMFKTPTHMTHDGRICIESKNQ